MPGSSIASQTLPHIDDPRTRHAASSSFFDLADGPHCRRRGSRQAAPARTRRCLARLRVVRRAGRGPARLLAARLHGRRRLVAALRAGGTAGRPCLGSCGRCGSQWPIGGSGAGCCWRASRRACCSRCTFQRADSRPACRTRRRRWPRVFLHRGLRAAVPACRLAAPAAQADTARAHGMEQRSRADAGGPEPVLRRRPWPVPEVRRGGPRRGLHGDPGAASGRELLVAAALPARPLEWAWRSLVQGRMAPMRSKREGQV